MVVLISTRTTLWSHEPRCSPTMMLMIRWSWLDITRCRKPFSRVGSVTSWLRKLASINSTILWDSLSMPVIVCQSMWGKLRSSKIGVLLLISDHRNTWYISISSSCVWPGDLQVTDMLTASLSPVTLKYTCSIFEYFGVISIGFLLDVAIERHRLPFG